MAIEMMHGTWHRLHPFKEEKDVQVGHVHFLGGDNVTQKRTPFLYDRFSTSSYP